MTRPASNRSVYLGDDEWAWAEHHAEKTGLSVNGVLREAVRSYRADLEIPNFTRPKMAPPGVALLGRGDSFQLGFADSVGMAKPDVLAVTPRLGAPPSVPGSRLKKAKGQ